MAKHCPFRKIRFGDILIITVGGKAISIRRFCCSLFVKVHPPGWKSLIDVNVKTLTGGSLLGATRRIFAAKLEANVRGRREILLIRLGSITLGLSVHVSCIALHSSWLQRSFLFGDCGLRKRLDRVHSNGCTSSFYVL